MNHPETVTSESLSLLNDRFRTQHDASIASLSRQSSVLVVFLRHSGCTFCRQTLQDLCEQRESIESDGTSIVLVHMGDNDASRSFFESFGLGDVHRISDPQCELYRVYDLSTGRFRQLLGPSVLWRGFRAAILDRHGFGMPKGDVFQMPGVFLVRDNQIITAYRHPNVSSRPDYCRVTKSVPG